MENKNLINNVKNNDMTKIDADSFCEGVLACIPRTKQNCFYIDKKIHRLTAMSFSPWSNVMECCDDVINNIMIKSELMELYKLFADWYKELSDAYKKIYLLYFVKKDGQLHNKNNKLRRKIRKAILDMSHSFMYYLKTMADFDENELIKNPYVYNSYVYILRKKQEKRGLRSA